jgi:hypothetical protein
LTKSLLGGIIITSRRDNPQRKELIKMMDFIFNGEKTIAVDLETAAIPVECAKAIYEAKQREKQEIYNNLVKVAIAHINKELIKGENHVCYVLTPYNTDISRADAREIGLLVEAEFKNKGYNTFIYDYPVSIYNKYTDINVSIPEEH